MSLLLGKARGKRSKKKSSQGEPKVDAEIAPTNIMQRAVSLNDGTVVPLAEIDTASMVQLKQNLKKLEREKARQERQEKAKQRQESRAKQRENKKKEREQKILERQKAKEQEMINQQKAKIKMTQSLAQQKSTRLQQATKKQETAALRREESVRIRKNNHDNKVLQPEQKNLVEFATKLGTNSEVNANPVKKQSKVGVPNQTNVETGAEVKQLDAYEKKAEDAAKGAEAALQESELMQRKLQEMEENRLASEKMMKELEAEGSLLGISENNFTDGVETIRDALKEEADAKKEQTDLEMMEMLANDDPAV